MHRPRFGQADPEQENEASDEVEDQDEDSGEDFIKPVETETTADDSTDENTPLPTGEYNLRTRNDIYYATHAVPVGLINDTPSIKQGLKSPEKDKSL